MARDIGGESVQKDGRRAGAAPTGGTIYSRDIARRLSETVMALSFAVLYGSVRPERQGIRVARFVADRLLRRGHAATLVDPKERPLPLLDRRYREYAPGTAPKTLETLAAVYRSVDGFVLVSGEYNAGIPPALKNLLDFFLAEYAYRPAAIVTYSGGDFGGVRAQLPLRATIAALGMTGVPSALTVPRVGQSFTEDGTPTDPDVWEPRAETFLEVLEWHAEALRAARQAGTPG